MGLITIKNESHKRLMTSAVEEGKRIYNDKCLVCHGSFDKADGAITLHNIQERWANKQELVLFIRCSERVPPLYIKDVAYTDGLKSNHSFEDLTDRQIQMILGYFHWEDTKYIQSTH